MKTPEEKPTAVICASRKSADNPARVYFIPENMVKALSELDRADYVQVGNQNAPVQVATLRDVLKTWDKDTKKNPHPRAALDLTPAGIILYEFPDDHPRNRQTLAWRKLPDTAFCARVILDGDPPTEQPEFVKPDKWLQLATAKMEDRPLFAKIYGNIGTDGFRFHRDLTLPEAPAPFDWRAVYPAPGDNLASIPVKRLAQAVKQAKGMNPDRVNLYFNGRMDVSATSEEFGDMRTSLTDDYQHTGADIEIAIRPRQLLEALSGMEGEIVFQISGTDRALILTDGKREAVIMPLRIG
jgi:hypothetical protein